MGEFGDKQGDTSPCTDRQQFAYRRLFYKLPSCQGDVETDLRISLHKSRTIYTPRRASYTFSTDKEDVCISRACLLETRWEGRVDNRWEKLNDEYRSARELCISLMFVAYVK